MTPLSQRDSKWANIKLGNSDLTIGGYGCTLTCISMAMGVTPDVANEKMKAAGAFQGSLVFWPNLSKAFRQINSTQRVAAYDNDAVKAAVEANGFCLVEVDFDGKIATPNDRHWVIYIGNGRMIDPWTGVEKSTGWYPIVKGYAVLNVQTISEPMTEKTYTELEMTAVRLERDKNWNLFQEASADAEKYKSEAESRKKELEDFIEDLAKDLFLPGTSDKSDIKGAVGRLLVVEDQLTAVQKKLDQQALAHEQEMKDLRTENEKIMAELNEAKAVIDKLSQRVEEQNARIEAQKEAQEMTNRFSKFIEGLLGFFKRK